MKPAAGWQNILLPAFALCCTRNQAAIRIDAIQALPSDFFDKGTGLGDSSTKERLLLRP